MDNADVKLGKLRRMLADAGSVAIAFSGGVDSTFLVAVAREVLGEKVLAVTAVSPTYPEREREESARLARTLGVRQEFVESDELKIPGFADNPPDRCYHCKSELFRLLREIAKRHGIEHIADGANADDVNDYRPGRRAGAEQGVWSPLLEAGLGKKEIRAWSRRMGLPTADKPAYACLASRFPYGSRITEEKLLAVDQVEQALREMGFGQVRVRHHGDLARIEVDGEAIERLASPEIRKRVVAAARGAGFTYVSVDLEGYRTGSMNESLALNHPRPRA